MLDKKQSFRKYEELLTTQGLKDADIARMSQVDPATISNWRNGNYMPKVETLERIANALGVDVMVFLREVN